MISRDKTPGDKDLAINDMHFHDYALKPRKKTMKMRYNVIRYHIVFLFSPKRKK